ncbi:hypothetical protein EV2_022802 [Malus domestica]
MAFFRDLIFSVLFPSRVSLISGKQCEVIEVRALSLSYANIKTANVTQSMHSNVTISEANGKSLQENLESESLYQRPNKLHNSSGLNLLSRAWCPCRSRPGDLGVCLVGGDLVF